MKNPQVCKQWFNEETKKLSPFMHLNCVLQIQTLQIGLLICQTLVMTLINRLKLSKQTMKSLKYFLFYRVIQHSSICNL